MGTHYLLLCLEFCPLSLFNIFQRQCKVWCFKFVKIAFIVHANIWKLSIKWTKSDSENCNSSNKTRKPVKTKSFSRSLIGATSIDLAAGSTIIAKINMQCLILLTAIIFSIKYDLCWLACNYCVPLNLLNYHDLFKVNCSWPGFMVELWSLQQSFYMRKEFFKMVLKYVFPG